MLGVVYQVQPQPPEPEHTQWFQAGAVTFGVEHRDVDPAALAATFGDDAAAMAEIEEKSPEGGFHDSGVSLHVNGTEDGHEYLRFDLFEGEPHYHYVRPSGDHNHVVPVDTVVHGDLLAFALHCLRDRLGPMLAEAGGEAVASALDPNVQHPVLADVEQLARRLTS